MKRLLVITPLAMLALAGQAQTSTPQRTQTAAMRTQQYKPEGAAFVCTDGQNRFTRALYSGNSGYRVETSDRPVFAIVSRSGVKNLHFEVAGVDLATAEHCRASYEAGMRKYMVSDSRLARVGIPMLRVNVVARHDVEGAIWQFIADKYPDALHVKVKMCDIAPAGLKGGGDLGIDDRSCFEPAPGAVVSHGECSWACNFAHLVMDGDQINPMSDVRAFDVFSDVVRHHQRLADRVLFQTPDPYVNAIAGVLVTAADGCWDGGQWRHGCIGSGTEQPVWRAAYAGDVLGWPERQRTYFDAFARSRESVAEPSPLEGGASLTSIDELLWHFQYNADTQYMRQMWPLITRHLEWEKRHSDPDGDHLYDAAGSSWAGAALNYGGAAVTHTSAYNYRANLLASRIAGLIGEDGTPYAREAEAILQAMNERLWLKDKGHWAEYQDMAGLKRCHESAAVWSVYAPIDCGACTPEQAFSATMYVDREIPHFNVSIDARGIDTLRTVATSNWMPYAGNATSVSPAETMHTALAYYEAGRPAEAYDLMMASVMDNMYLGQSPANFGQLSHFDAARGECYRDYGDCIGATSRTLIQGLFGVQPDALSGRCVIRPGFPSSWGQARLATPYIDYRYTRSNGFDRYEVTQNFAQPLKIVIRQNLGDGRYRDVEGNSERYQVISVPIAAAEHIDVHDEGAVKADAVAMGLSEPTPVGSRKKSKKSFRRIDLSGDFNASVADVRADVDDSGLRSLVKGGEVSIASVPFRTPKQGHNIVFTSLSDTYPDEVSVPLKGKSTAAYLLMAGTTSVMQSHIDNGVVTVHYTDGSTDVMPLRNPDNWCPIEQDYYIDGQAFNTIGSTPYRICLGNGTVSRDLGKELGLPSSAAGRIIPGGAAQMLRMPLDGKKRLKSITVRTLSNDVVVGLMAVTLE